jgi:hypothetical protein
MDFESICMICAETLSAERLPCVVKCGHNSTCAVCFLRIRSVLKDKGCPVCKQELENVVCCSPSAEPYESYGVEGCEYVPGFLYDHKSSIFFPPPYYRKYIEPLWKCVCSICNTAKRDLKSLRLHVIHEHKMHMCNLCLEFKQSFPSEQVIYTQKDYDTHLRCGNGDGSEGHPVCEFCKKRYYDKHDLFVHLSKDHYTCFLCEKEGIQYRYFKDYNALQSHLTKSHYACTDPGCLERRFVAFATEWELSSHNASWHPHLNVRTRGFGSHQIQFKTHKQHERERETGNASSASGDNAELLIGMLDGDGQNFQGGMGGSAVNGEWQVELVENRALDPRASERGRDELTPTPSPAYLEGFEIRTNHESVEEFPSLESQRSVPTSVFSLNPSSHGNRGKYGGSARAGKKEEDFPGLGASSTTRTTTAAKGNALSWSSSQAPENSGGGMSGLRIRVDKRFKGEKSVPKDKAQSSASSSSGSYLAKSSSSSAVAGASGVSYGDSISEKLKIQNEKAAAWSEGSEVQLEQIAILNDAQMSSQREGMHAFGSEIETSSKPKRSFAAPSKHSTGTSSTKTQSSLTNMLASVGFSAPARKAADRAKGLSVPKKLSLSASRKAAAFSNAHNAIDDSKLIAVGRKQRDLEAMTNGHSEPALTNQKKEKHSSRRKEVIETGFFAEPGLGLNVSLPSQPPNDLVDSAANSTSSSSLGGGRSSTGKSISSVRSGTGQGKSNWAKIGGASGKMGRPPVAPPASHPQPPVPPPVAPSSVMEQAQTRPASKKKNAKKAQKKELLNLAFSIKK